MLQRYILQSELSNFEEKAVAEPRTRKEREIWQVCEILWEEGFTLKKMTGDAIAERLIALGYARGSNTDLHRFKKSWAASKGLSYTDPSASNESEPLSDPILLAAKALREQVQVDAEQEIKRIQHEANEKEQALTAQLELLKAEEHKMQSTLQDLQERYDRLAANLERLQRGLVQEQQQRLLAEERAKLQEQHLSEMREATQKQVGQLEMQHTESVAKLKEQMAIKEVEHEKILSELKNQHEAMRHRWIVDIDAQKVAQQKNQKLIQTLQVDNQKLLSEKQGLEQQLANYEKEVTLYPAKLAVLEDNVRQNDKAYARLEGECDQLKELLSDYQMQNLELHSTKTNNEVKIALLEAEIKQLHLHLIVKKGKKTENMN